MTNAPDACIVGSLFVFVVQDAHDLHALVHPYIEWCDGTLLITCCWCVDVQVDEGVLFFELLEVLLVGSTGISRLQLM